MATLYPQSARRSGDERFFLKSAVLMAAIIVAGFSMQLAMGRSTFAAPWLLHAHAVVFFGWVVLFVTQTALADRGSIALHRLLGWVGVGWIMVMLALGTAVTLEMVRRGAAPFFFLPQHFLIANPLTLFVFVGLTLTAIGLRRRTDWHRRLHLSAMALLLGPAFGRLLPMPLLAPWAYEAALLAGLLFPIAGAIRDRRRTGRVHPAWIVGIGTALAATAAIDLIAYGPMGDAIYRAAMAGHPGASVPGLAFPPPPTGPLITGGGTAI